MLAPAGADRKIPTAAGASSYGAGVHQTLDTSGISGPEDFPDRQDQGLFGPGSVSWRVFLDPSAQLGMVCAVLMQALNPGMMRLFDHASNNAADPAGRAERTGRYVLTTVFGDRAHAEAAGAAVRRLHSLVRWTDPKTGDVLAADTPEWLEWTHNCIVWGVLRAAATYGPRLSAQEQDQFVVEQHRCAELVGIDPERLVSAKADLDAYVEAQQEWMALTLPAAEAVANLRKPSLKGNPLAVLQSVVVQDGIVALLPSWGYTLYGIEGRPLNLQLATRATGLLLAAARRSKPYQRQLRDTLAQVEAHPYRRLRGERGT